ncbi:MAG TPA: DUF4012 domain-containing protein [Candidatus Bathyarchaeia archaeon]|nr:DUF4012 domain-containing protein [Candidatus Bathyarchaeia archaeon]
MTFAENKQSSSITSKPVALVAGGAGFIGSFLCQSLLLQGCRVFAFDNLITGTKDNLKGCLGHPDFRFIEHNLREPVVEIDRADYVFHLAGMEGNRRYPLKHLLVNSEGTKNLLDFALKSEAKFLLGSSVNVFSSAVITKSLKNLLGDDILILNHSEAKRFAEELTLDYFKNGLNARVVRLGWIYGPRMNLHSDREIIEVFRSVIETNLINIPGSGDQEIYPTFISDIIYGLTKAMFTMQTNGEIFTLTGPEKIAFFDLAQKLKKYSVKELKINFISEREEKVELDQSVSASQKKLGWKPRVKVDEGIKRTIDYFSPAISSATTIATTGAETANRDLRTGEQSEEPAKKTEEMEVSLKPRLPKIRFRLKIVSLMIILFASCVLVILPFLPPLYHSFFGIRGLKNIYQDFSQDKLDSLGDYAFDSLGSFQKANQQWVRVDEILAVVGLRQITASLEGMSLLGERIAKTAVYAVKLMEKAEKINEVILKNETGDLSQLSSETKVALEITWRELSFLESELEKNEYLFNQFKLFNFSPVLTNIRKILPQGRDMLNDLNSLLNILPDIAGYNANKTYLVLLQNNMELRATGGFIGSFVLVNFQQGHLKEFEVFDVYTADGQLKGHVEPPKPIKEYLKEGGWYLRDSNWDANYPTSAIRAEWFLEKTLNRKVDGVVAVNLNLAYKLLESIGPIELTDLNEKIEAGNFFVKAERYAEVGFFPGSTQKRDFLGSLSRTLIEKIRSGSRREMLKLGQAIYSSLEEKDVLIYLNDARQMETINFLGWEGSLRQLSCPNSLTPCVKDYLMVVESNLGVNKANFYLKRSLSLQNQIDREGVIIDVLKIDYLNMSPENSPLGGDYKNYFRVFLPLGSSLISVKIDGVALPDEKVDLGISAEKTFFGLLLEIPVGQKKNLEICYQLPFMVEKGEEVDYLFFWQKQSGADPSRLSLNMILPTGSSIIQAIPKPARISDGVWFEQKLDRDLLFQTRIKL